MVSFVASALCCFAVQSCIQGERGSTIYSMSEAKRLKMAPTADAVHGDPDPETVPLSTQRRITVTPTRSADDAIRQIKEYTKAMNERAKDNAVFTQDEINGIVSSLQNVLPPTEGAAIPWDELRDLLIKVAHVSHKDWQLTGRNSVPLGQLLRVTASQMDASANDSATRQLLERILREGNWDGAAANANAVKATTMDHSSLALKPWAVLVTGVNGIRKTTSMYQEWFPRLLEEALVAPTGPATSPHHPIETLPTGANSFFRQLDHMIATLCNEEFVNLYALTRDMLDAKTDAPGSDVVQLYSNLKAAIFTRYRTLSELLGVALLREAQILSSNCLLETSGRDVAMFHYVDEFFPDDTYHKLALHFTINELQYAKESVDQRMIREIRTGMTALTDENVFAIINANAGGPYGSEVLEGIQADSDRVWNTDVVGTDSVVGQHWYKATIQINAHATQPWTAQAVRPDGSLGTEFQFERK